MAIRDAWSFDDADTIAEHVVSADAGTPTISTVAPRTGAQSLRVTGGASVPARAGVWSGSAMALGATFGVAFGYRPGWTIGTTTGLPPASQVHYVVAFFETNTPHVKIGVLNDGNVMVCRHTTELGRTTTPPGIAKDTNAHWEVKLNVHDSTGAVEVKITGVALTFSWVTGGDTTQDTRNGASGTVNRVSFSSQSTDAALASYIDDVVIWDATGADVTDFIGDKGVYYYPENGAGTYTDWTPNTGTNTAAVDDLGTVDGDTTYVASSTAGDQDSYTTPTVPAGTIVAVASVIRARKDDAGSRTFRPFWRRSGTDYVGTTVSASDGYTRHVEVFHNDPSDSADWTNGDFGAGASEIGVELVS